jgi:hypothetical protein
MALLPTQFVPNTTAQKLATQAPIATNPVNSADTFLYQANVLNDYDTDSFMVSGNTTTIANQKAINEYFRRTATLPNAVTLIPVNPTAGTASAAPTVQSNLVPVGYQANGTTTGTAL